MKRYFDEIKNFDPLTREDEKETMLKAKAGNRRAYDKIINHNLRFVVSVAKTYQNKGLPLEELIGEGNLGLLKAFARFDTSRDVKFITYAVWWVRQSIVTALHENSKLIRLPINQISQNTKVYKMSEELERKLGRTPGTEELEDYLDSENVLHDTQYLHMFIGLDEPRTINRKNLNEILPTDELSLHSETLAAEFKVELDDLLKGFPERERKIILRV